MKKKHVAIGILSLFLIYTVCTASGAMKLRALFITKNPLIYFSNTAQSENFGAPYYTFTDEVRDSETGNLLGVFKCTRTLLFVSCTYIGFP